MSLNKTRRYSRHTYGDDGATGKRNILSVSFVATDLRKPAAANSTAVSTAITASNSAATTGTLDVELDTPRNITITAGGTAASITASAITVTGTNAEGKVITEDLTPTAATAGLITGNKAFKTVTAYSIPQQSGTGATYAIGTGAKLGIGMRNMSSMPVKVLVDNALEDASASAFSSTAVESNTVTPTTTPNGSKAMRVYVLNYKWAVDPTNGNPDYGV
ncbi:MAG TPA: hypothetical protein VFL85_01530 [Candidatus Saccharimonadales bacterium]|nr:hypothetical protein [Candidatus Saccharimonadales bacterium]